ncbi:guanylate cyclase domain-containing protein, partial [Haematococcus lacustris]
MALEPSGTGVNSTINRPAVVRALYRKSIGYLPPPAPPQAPPPPSSSPPHIVTQPSQILHASDAKLHHEVIRRSSMEHRGYECCTEGDSFILAFHTPSDAARFAVAAQAALVLAPWPQQLYQLEVCKPVWVSPVTNFKSLPQLLSTRHQLPDDCHNFRPSLTRQTSASWEESSTQDAPEPLTRRKPGYLLTVRRPLANFRGITWSAPGCGIGAGAPYGANVDQAASGPSPFQWEQLYASPGISALQRAMSTRTPLQLTATVTAVGAPAGIPPRSSGDDESTGAWITAADDGCSSLVAGPVAMHEHLKRLVPVAAGPGPGRVLIFQGLRVRMGMASGTSSAEEVTFNASLGRVKYGGALMAAAKAIQDTAQGGMVLATSSTFKQLSVESLGLLVISMGEHVLKAGEEAVQ